MRPRAVPTLAPEGRRVTTSLSLPVSYLALVVFVSTLWNSPLLLTAMLAAQAPLMFWYFAKRETIMAFIVGMSLGAVGEIVAALSGAWTYLNSDLLLPTWIPLAWGIVGVLIVGSTDALVRVASPRASRTEDYEMHAADGRGKDPRTVTTHGIEPEFAKELLNIKRSELDQLTAHYLKALAIFIAISGVIVKFSLDQESTEVLSRALATLGIGCSLVGMLACIVGERLRRIIVGEIVGLSSVVGVPNLASDSLSLKYTLGFSACIAASALGVWVWILIH